MLRSAPPYTLRSSGLAVLFNTLTYAKFFAVVFVVSWLLANRRWAPLLPWVAVSSYALFAAPSPSHFAVAAAALGISLSLCRLSSAEAPPRSVRPQGGDRKRDRRIALASNRRQFRGARVDGVPRPRRPKRGDPGRRRRDSLRLPVDGARRRSRSHGRVLLGARAEGEIALPARCQLRLLRALGLAFFCCSSSPRHPSTGCSVTRSPAPSIHESARSGSPARCS